MKSEFEFINDLKSRFSLGKVGDDCAVLPSDDKTDLLVTADLLIEDIDFRLEWTTPEFLGHKALAVSLSDIAAMGGTPKWSLVSIGVPKDLWKTDFLDRFYDGWHKLARKNGVELVGGDVSRSPDKLVIDSMVGGEVATPTVLRRSGASIGDAIVVTDHIGGSAGGLQLLNDGYRLGEDLKDWQEVLIRIHLQPWPQVGTGIYLTAGQLATAAIDISDGLSGDLLHLCEASNVGASIRGNDLPINLNLEKLCSSFDEELALALDGGEDYQLLFTLPQEKVPALSSGMIGGKDYGLFSVIGEVTPNIGIVELVRDGGVTILKPKSYRHF